jgi:cytochrome o ubiquinol oxidase subunit 2
MMRKIRIALISIFFIGVLAISFAYIGNHNVAVLNPKGMIAAKQSQLFYTATWLMLIVVVPVFFMTLFFAWKYREGNKGSKYTPNWSHSTIAECFWWGVPFIIIVILSVITWESSHDLSPYKPIDSDKKAITIQAVALDWKWLFIYPEQGIATVNFVQFPEKTPISFEITSDAPMNSFWIPQLGGQIYAMPAMATKLHLIADEVGSFRGSSSNISGDGFAGMTFTAKASSDAEFEQWVQTVKQSPKHLDMDEYNALVKPSSYVPPAFYQLMRNDLFDHIVNQYHTH